MNNHSFIKYSYIFSSLIVILCVLGVYAHYIPIPYWDMWDGTIKFFLNIGNSNIGSWWVQHNEHRILLARIIFYIDNAYFQGLGYFSIFSQFLLIVCAACIFMRVLNEISAINKEKLTLLFFPFILALLFLGVQKENLTWAFQSQFFLAQLLPLCTFYFSYQSTQKSPKKYFFLTCFFGILSYGTMANGVLSLPLVTLYSLWTKQSKARVATLSFLTFLMLFFYFYDYKSNPGHASPLQSLSQYPLEMIAYTLSYLGSPFYHLSAGTLSISLTLGLFFIFSTCRLCIHSLFSQKRQEKKSFNLKWMLLFFISYIVSTALITASGRINFGTNQATVSRYTTPVLMAWSALFLLYVPTFSRVLKSKYKKVFSISMGAFLFYVFTFQVVWFASSQSKKALEKKRRDKLAALALELQVKDFSYIKNLYPVPDHVLAIAKEASQRNIAIFGISPYKGAFEKINKRIEDIKDLPACKFHFQKIEKIKEDPRYLRIQMTLQQSQKKSPESLTLSYQNKIIGYAIPISSSNFYGYIQRNYTHKRIQILGEKPSCQSTLSLK